MALHTKRTQVMSGETRGAKLCRTQVMSGEKLADLSRRGISKKCEETDQTRSSEALHHDHSCTRQHDQRIKVPHHAISCNVKA
jgi:hypothetical protein